MKHVLIYLAGIALAVGVFFGARALWTPRGPQIEWQLIAMDCSMTGAVPVNAENAATALGTFTDEDYIAPSGVHFAEGPVPVVASVLMEAQPGLAYLKEVVGHSARTMPNLRTEPETLLSNLFTDAMLERGSAYFGVPMDMSLANFGGIRCPLPEGPVTLEDITTMFPFKNYMVYAQMKGSAILELFDQLALTRAFQAVGGCRVKVVDHKVKSAAIGGEPVDPERLYNVVTVDFLLDGGDQINIGALSERVILSRVLLRDVMLEFVRSKEAAGEVIDSRLDGRVIMEETKS